MAQRRSSPLRGSRAARRVLGLAIVAPAFAALLAFASTSVTACGVGDQYCPDDTLDTDLDDDCPYGPPGGPQEPAESCPTITFLDADDPVCDDASFEAVAAVFDGAGSCTLGPCHGTAQAAAVAKGVDLLPGDPAQMYAELSKYLNGNGEPYLKEDTPRSWILCNLKAQVGGGSPMPTSFPLLTETPDDLAVVEKWVACGMKPPGQGSGPSSSASSSSGGEGGLGDGGGTGGAGEGGAGGGAGGDGSGGGTGGSG